MVARFFVDALIVILIVFFLLVLLIGEAFVEMDSARLWLFSLTMALFIYLLIEIRFCIRRHRQYLLIVIPVLASIFTFFMSFGVSNFQYLSIDVVVNDYRGLLSPSPVYWMIQAMIGALIGAFAMWRGYHSFIGRSLGRSFKRMLQKKKVIHEGFRIRWAVLYACIALSMVARVVQINLGVFGYNADIEQLYLLAAYRQYLDLLAGLGTLALVSLSFAFFSNTEKRSFRLLAMLAAVLVIEVLVGFLLGFKGRTVLPIVIVGLVYYICNRTIPKPWIMVAMSVLVLSYQIIEPFRASRFEQTSFDNRDLAAIASEVTDIALNERNQDINYLERILTRSNLTLFAGASMAATEKQRLGEQAPGFINRIIMSPIYAFVPRIVWPSKPYSNIGYWFNTEILGAPLWTKSSVGMSPVGYLYFAGGMTGIFFGFFLIGILQRFVFESFAMGGPGGWVVYLGLMESLVLIDSDVGSIFTSFFRYLPIMIFAQYFLFRPESRSSSPGRARSFRLSAAKGD